MTDSMVEKVARAISPHDLDLLDGSVPGHSPGKCPQCDDSREIIYRRVRAAIEAMREPTEAMKLAGMKWVDNDLCLVEAYSAMISEALKQ